MSWIHAICFLCLALQASLSGVATPVAAAEATSKPLSSVPAGANGLPNRALIYGTPELAAAMPRPAGPIALGPGPYLFLDDWLIESAAGVRRVVCSPPRDPQIPNPVVTAKDDRSFQPFFTVSRVPETGRFRIWYGRWRDDQSMSRSQVGYLESDDGIRWQRPARVLAEPGPLQFGSEVLDRGPAFSDPSRRYSYCWWFDGGTRIAFSADGFHFTPASPRVVLPHDHDISNIWYDPLRGHYLATISSMRELTQFRGRRRTTLMATSPDLLAWSPPWIVLAADDRYDRGVLQFYAMAGYLRRGGLIVGLVKNLHDDWKAEGCPKGAFGVGSTSLAWSRDGQTWIRDREVFFEPDPAAGAWDHAHAWGDEQLVVGDQVYLYYGGYKWGHKHNRFQERQIGLVRFARDRYVGREATGGPSRLLTVPIVFDGSALAVNAKVSRRMQLRLVDLDDRPIPGFEGVAITGDSLAHPIRFGQSLAALRGRAVRIQFELHDAQLFAFEVFK